jgi:hypothetical protein
MPRARERHVFVDEVDGNLSTGGTSGQRQRPARIAVEIAARRCGSGRDVLEALPDPSPVWRQNSFSQPFRGADHGPRRCRQSRLCSSSGRRPCPVVAILLEGKKKRRRVHCCPQRAWTPDPCGFSPCKPAVFKGPPEGAMIAVVDPRQADAVMVGEGHTPLWQYFWRLQKADERIFAPKGHGPRTVQFWLNHEVRGNQEGRRGPHSVSPSQPDGEGLPSLWQYFSRLLRGRRRDSRAQKRQALPGAAQDRRSPPPNE